MRRMVSEISKHGWHAVVYNRRGHAKEKPHIPVNIPLSDLHSAAGDALKETADPDTSETGGAKPAAAMPAKMWALYCDVCDTSQVRHLLTAETRL